MEKRAFPTRQKSCLTEWDFSVSHIIHTFPDVVTSHEKLSCCSIWKSGCPARLRSATSQNICDQLTASNSMQL